MKERRQYTLEFKREAVRLSRESRESVAQVARELGITPKILYRWRQEFNSLGEDAFPGHGKLPTGEEEMVQLRRELSRVKQERDILKKALAIFSQER